MKITYKLATGAALILALGGAAWKGLPLYVKHRVEQEVPGSRVGSVTLHPWHVDLHWVQVERPGLWADLPLVRVERDRSVHVLGGNVALTKAAATEAKGVSTSAHKITFERLHVTTTWNGMELEAHGVSGSPDSAITAETATARHGKFGTATVRNATRFTSGTFRADEVRVHGFPPLPTDPCKEVVLEGVEVFPKEKRVTTKVVTCGGNRADGLTVTQTEKGFRARTDTLVVTHPWLHPVPLVLSYPVTADWDGEMIGAFIGDEYSKAHIGIVVDPEGKQISIMGDCGEIAARMPLGLAEPLNGFEFTGSFDLRVSLGKDPGVRLKASCRAKCSAPKLRELRGKFTYRPYDASWKRVERVSGPGSRDWVPLPLVAPAMPTAAIAMEDPGFPAHRGWISQALHNSLLMNIAAGTFKRGGSTITMQVAKNLWLSRDKTLGRKMQEILLASALESCLSKDQILELYLNIIEYGPNLYGIGPATEKWFGVTPMELTPRQAFWLASILPKPRSATKPDDAALTRMEAFVRKLVEFGRVPETMLETVPEGADAEW